jgi:IS1 family transposase
MAALTTERQTAVIGALVEGSSIRSTERMTGIHRDTIMRLVARVGRACGRMMDEEIRHVRPGRLELDEVWSFVGCKKANLKRTDDASQRGDFWTWVAFDPDTKLVPAHVVGKRDNETARELGNVLRRRVEGRIQISTDKLAAYRETLYTAFGGDVDWGCIVKRFASEPIEETRRYSPPKVVAVERETVMGDPVVTAISTSGVERNHLTMRMGIRRMTRLTNGFSKKADNLRAAIALHFAYYNFVRVHSSIRTTPAMASGVASRKWAIADLATLPY